MTRYIAFAVSQGVILCCVNSTAALAQLQIPGTRPKDPNNELQLPESDIPDVQIEVEPPPIPERQFNIPKPIVVQRFEISGNTVISTETIEAALAEFLNTPLSSDDLLAAESKVGKLYDDQGYLTTFALLVIDDNQLQEVDGGTLKLTIFEGKQEQINVAGTKRLRKYVRDRIRAERSGVINQDALQQSLLLLSIDPRIKSIQTNLDRGSEIGKGVINAEVKPANPVSFSVSLNNYRSPFIGSFERRVDFDHLNVFGLGDTFSLSYRNTDGSNAILAGYTVPLNSMNGTLGVDYQYSSSRIIEEPFDILELKGRSDIFGVTYRQPIVRVASNKRVEEFALGLRLTHENSTLRSPFIPFAVSRGADDSGRYKATKLIFFQDWAKVTGSYSFSLRSQFNVGLNIASTNNASRPDGQFFTWQGGVRFAKPLSRNGFRFIFSANVQLADGSLPSSEQFSFGGQDTVRGYRQNLLSFDNGFIGSIAVEIPIARGKAGTLVGYPFFDIGTGWNSADSLIPTPNTLAAGGIGVKFQLNNRFELKAEWGIPFINRPGVTNSLNDQGIYVSVGYKF
ncbi:MAG: ShlB/FhaC/HecB family hemolysin secretion/activation protein [Thermosynechococcaceae cyanobacterium]